MQIEKMKSTARFWNTGMKVVGGIFSACGIVCAVFALLVLVAWKETLMTGSFTLELGYITVHLAEGSSVDLEMMKWFACVGLTGSAVICFLVQWACVHLRAILTPMEEGRPFEPGTSGRLKKIAWITLVGGLLVQILGIAERLILTQAYPLDTLFASEVVEKVEYSFKIDPIFLWAACLLLFLSNIFSYGQNLQREADETL